MPDVTTERLLAVIDQIYAAACDDDRWTFALTATADLLGGTAGHLLYHDHASHAGGIARTIRTDPDAAEAYLRYYHHVDPWATSPGMLRAQPGDVVSGHSLVDRRAMLRSEYYAAIGRRFDLSRALIAIVDRSAAASTVVSFNRGDADDEFGARDAASLSVLAPHFRRALRVRRHVRCATDERGSGGEAFAAIDTGVVLCARDCRIVFANDEARRIAALRDGFLLGPDGVGASTAGETQRLRRALAAVSDPLRGVASALVLGRPSGLPAWQVVTAPAPRDASASAVGRGAIVLVLIRDPGRRPVSTRLLQRYFELTPAEARLAKGLLVGQTPREAADSLKLAHSTTRWMIERLRTKTHTRSLAQAVSAMASSLARLTLP